MFYLFFFACAFKQIIYQLTVSSPQHAMCFAQFITWHWIIFNWWHSTHFFLLPYLLILLFYYYYFNFFLEGEYLFYCTQVFYHTIARIKMKYICMYIYNFNWLHSADAEEDCVITKLMPRANTRKMIEEKRRKKNSNQSEVIFFCVFGKFPTVNCSFFLLHPLTITSQRDNRQLTHTHTRDSMIDIYSWYHS